MSTGSADKPNMIRLNVNYFYVPVILIILTIQFIAPLLLFYNLRHQVFLFPLHATVEIERLFKNLHLNSVEFLTEFALTGMILYFLTGIALLFKLIEFCYNSFLKAISVILLISLIVSTLIAHDSYESVEHYRNAVAALKDSTSKGPYVFEINLNYRVENPANNFHNNADSLVKKSLDSAFRMSVDSVFKASQFTEPTTFWATVYSMFTKRQAITLLTLFTFMAIVIIVYYFIKSFVKVSNSGIGIQISWPGQTQHFLPVFPQETWQSTHIYLKEGDKFKVEINGFVNPGGLFDIDKMKKFLTEFDNARRGKGVLHHDHSLSESKPETMPSSKPSGYPEEYYNVEKTVRFKGHAGYDAIENYYKENNLLSIKGATHCTVIGIILPKGERPKEPKLDRNNINESKPAYDMDKDHELLYKLSSENYPIELEARSTGYLWVVINDDDIARYDNTGMYFLKLTHRTKWF